MVYSSSEMSNRNRLLLEFPPFADKRSQFHELEAQLGDQTIPFFIDDDKTTLSSIKHFSPAELRPTDFANALLDFGRPDV